MSNVITPRFQHLPRAPLPPSSSSEGPFTLRGVPPAGGLARVPRFAVVRTVSPAPEASLAPAPAPVAPGNRTVLRDILSGLVKKLSGEKALEAPEAAPTPVLAAEEPSRNDDSQPKRAARPRTRSPRAGTQPGTGVASRLRLKPVKKLAGEKLEAPEAAPTPVLAAEEPSRNDDSQPKRAARPRTRSPRAGTQPGTGVAKRTRTKPVSAT